MRVTIFGSGYVGLVTGACLADAGNHVVCVDVDAAKIERLKRGEVPIHEPGLEALIRRNAEAGRIEFTTDAARGVAHGLFQLIAVGTPPGEDGSADLRYVLAVARTIGTHLRRYGIVITKSTVPVGTADKVRAELTRTLAARGAHVEFDVVSNPEFLKEGAAIADFMKPDRVVIGTDNPRTTELMRALYEPFTRNHDRLIVMDIRSSELTKYAANAMLATKISFMNELANIAERVGADIEKVRIGIGSDPRIGYSFIYPGTGYGGSCFPKDVQALIRSAHEAGHEPQILDAVEAVNARQKEVLFRKMQRHFGGELTGRTLALWGLAFKPNTDDMREAPARALIDLLLKAGARVRAYDPVAGAEAQRLYAGAGGFMLAKNAYEAAEGADALAIVTEWQEFRSPDFERLQQIAQDAGDLRRPQPLRPGHGGPLRLHLLRHRPRQAAGARRDGAQAGAMLTPVILSGGAGTRLWPLSRELYPKQLLALTGTRTMLQQTALRLDGLAARARRWWCATRRTASWWPSSCGSCRSSRARSSSSLSAATPRRRSRSRRSPRSRGSPPMPTRVDPVLLVLPADHVIRDVPAFQQAVRLALAAGRGRAAGDLRHRGRRAPRPATATSSAARADGGGVPHRALRREARRRARARVPRVRRLLLEQRHVPVPRAPLPGGAAALRAGDRARLRGGVRATHRPTWISRASCRRASRRARRDSIDYAVMEKTADAVVVPLAAGWSDVGSWAALHEASDSGRARQRGARRRHQRGHATAATCMPRAAWWRPSG